MPTAAHRQPCAPPAGATESQIGGTGSRGSTTCRGLTHDGSHPARSRTPDRSRHCRRDLREERPLPISRMSRRLKQWRKAEQAARATDVPADVIMSQWDEALSRDLDRSAESEPARAAERERAQEHLERQRKAIDRREFLRRGAAAGAAGAGFAYLPVLRRPPTPSAPRVVIVGAGFAGLTAAYRIYRSKGWIPEVYEARTRVGVSPPGLRAVIPTWVR